MTTASLAAGAYAKTAAQGLATALKPPTSTGDGTDSFGAMLGQAMNGMSQIGSAADSAALNVSAGRTDLINVVTAVAESETAMQTLVSVRDRVIAAYEEIMRMPI